MDRKVLFERSPVPRFDEFGLGELTNEQFRIAQANSEATLLMDNVYRQYLEEYIWPHPIIERTEETRKELDKHYRLLKSPSARMPLLLIWKKSSPYKEQLRTSKDAPPYLSASELGLALWREEQNRFMRLMPRSPLPLKSSTSCRPPALWTRQSPMARR